MLREDVLSIAWWNTSLAARAQRREPGATRSQAQLDRMWRQAEQVVRTLVDERHVDVLALGEVTRDDVGRLRRACSTPLQELIDPGGGLRTTDIGLLFDPTKVRLVDHVDQLTDVFGRKLSVGLRAQFRLDETSPLLHLHAAHWASQSRGDEGRLLRANVSFDTKYDLRELLTPSAGARPYVVVMGDLNAEPFDRELTDSLGSTRDRALAKTRPGLMYNPFWRLLGERQTMEGENGAQFRKGAGTHYHRSQLTDRWRTFDQLLVSPSLLGGGGWALWEDKVDIWQAPPLLGDLGRPLDPFDHFPVFGALRREVPAGALQES